MDRIDDAVDREAGLIACSQNFVPIEIARAVEIDAVEADVLEHLELVFDRSVALDHAPFDSLFVLLVRGALGRIRDKREGRRSSQRGAGDFEKISPISRVNFLRGAIHGCSCRREKYSGAGVERGNDALHDRLGITAPQPNAKTPRSLRWEYEELCQREHREL